MTFHSLREARHPNVVLYLGLSRAPAPNNTIYIISEFIPNGNLRTYIFNKHLPLPWRLRLSFATDITRALAYLHARNCIHRDLKGENLLITSNGRLKITDFGFARIAARDEVEKKRLTFCGTDSYMSPEIMTGQEFGLSTDIYSLGIIFCELIARKLADDHTFKRIPPYYDLNEAEVRELASPGCPEDLIRLALECCRTDPEKRPTVLQILERLRVIELEVLNRATEDETYHVGSVKLFTGVGTKRATKPGMGPRIPSFGSEVKPEPGDSDYTAEVRGRKGDNKRRETRSDNGSDSTLEETSEDEELMEAIEGMVIAEDDGPDRLTAKPKVANKKDEGTRKLQDAKDSLPLHHARQEAHANDLSSSSDSVSDHNTVIDHLYDKATESTLSQEPLLNERLGHPTGSLVYTDYSTSVIKKNGNAPPSLSSVLTARPADSIPTQANPSCAPIDQSGFKTLTTDSRVSIDSYHTANDVTSSLITASSAPSVAIATIGGSSVRSEIIGGLHRFTLIKPGAGDAKSMIGGSRKPSNGKRKSFDSKSPSKSTNASSSYTSWSPFEFFFGSGFGFGKDKDKEKSGKCDLCGKRLGWRACLECDDCGLRTHIKCGEDAPRDCGLRRPEEGVSMRVLGKKVGVKGR